jgi:hypothetical protein
MRSVRRVACVDTWTRAAYLSLSQVEGKRMASEMRLR